ncbi:hypothetical protein AAIB33_14680 [Microbacterium sp. AZCO]|uniref:hypothetical protein n=1 Tax=Microbacterium sp. AZCO TaxID=3142976 RepID=UPI0031F3CC45
MPADIDPGLLTEAIVTYTGGTEGERMPRSSVASTPTPLGPSGEPHFLSVDELVADARRDRSGLRKQRRRPTDRTAADRRASRSARRLEGDHPMNQAEFDRIVQDERLGRWLLRAEPSGASANKVCLFEKQGTWYTLTTDERAGVIETTRRSFGAESEALADALEGLRFLKHLLNFRA